MIVTRRKFLSGLALASASPALLANARDDQWQPRPQDLAQGSVFNFGVASGDPLAHRVILWTRVTPSGRKAKVNVRWALSRDPFMRKVVQKGKTRTGPERDYTVKVDAPNLQSDSTYYFQFKAMGDTSPIGRTRTLPLGTTERIRLGVVSCANFGFGFFAAYRLLAQRPDLNAVLHLGDYIYEHASGVSGNGGAIGRIPQPEWELLSLDDYRTRHAQYKADANLQECHRQHPFICVWDDHEVANDGWRGGAEGHQTKNEGSWTKRKRAALQAYFEWMPIRDNSGSRERRVRIFRRFKFGQLAELDMLDTRFFRRDKQAPAIIDEDTGGLAVPADDIPAILAEIADPARQLLGSSQEAWLFKRLLKSKEKGVIWRLLGQQVMMGQLKLPLEAFNLFLPLNTDQWDGYESARDRVLGFVESKGINNVCVLTGDIHSSWAQDLAKNPYDGSYDSKTGAGALAVEFVTPAVTSSGISESRAPSLEAQLRLTQPHLKYVDLTRRGYLLLDVTVSEIQADWYFVDDVLDPKSGESHAASFKVLAGTAHVVQAKSPAVDGREAPALAPALSARQRWRLA